MLGAQGTDATNSVTVLAYVADSFGAFVRCTWNSQGVQDTLTVVPHEDAAAGNASATASFVANNVDALLHGALDVGNGAAVVSNSAVMAATLQAGLQKCNAVSCGDYGVCVYGECVCVDGAAGAACEVLTPAAVSVADEAAVCVGDVDACEPLAQVCPGSSEGVYNLTFAALYGARVPKVECSGHGQCTRTQPAKAAVCRYVFGSLGVAV